MTSVLAVVITIATSDHSWARDSIGKVKDVACRHRMPTDKVTYPQMAGGHQYHIMYGLFLVPLVHRVGHSRPAKMLEIGLGCGMKYGAGASALLWRELFSQTELELWEAEVDKVCVEKHRVALQSQGINVIVGNQADEHTLAIWVNATGGSFDAVIDDGSHKNLEIMRSCHALWPHVRPGGLYFMEDLQVGRYARDGGGHRYDDSLGNSVVSDVIQSWTEQLLIRYPPPKLDGFSSPIGNKTDTTQWGSHPANTRAIEIRQKFPLPEGVAWIFCQAEACVIGKADPANTNRPCTNAKFGGRRR